MWLTGYRCWRLTLLLLSAVVAIEGAIQCYCNREECKESHTCISHAEKCYSKFFRVYENENKTSGSSENEHGCVDDFVNAERHHLRYCDGNGDEVKQMTAVEPLLMCCSDNMCNYRKSQDIHVDIINPQIETKEVKRLQKFSTEIPSTEATDRQETPEAPQSNEDVIFRAAVIAVPIAGGLILVILILMAVRMLREDYRRSDSHNRLIKAHSFIQQHFVRKDEKKNYKSKKITSNPIKNCADLPRSEATASQWSEANDSLISHQPDANGSTNKKLPVRVSLLPAKTQSSDISLV